MALPHRPSGICFAILPACLAFLVVLTSGCGGTSSGRPASLTGDPVATADVADRAALRSEVARCGFTAQLSYELGASFWESSCRDSSRFYLEQANLIDPYHVPTLTWLSRLYYEQGDIAEGIALLEPVVSSIADPAPEILANLAVLRLAWGDVQTAVDHLLVCQEMHPDYAPAYGNLGYIYLKLDDLPSAEHELRAAIREDDTVPEYWNNLGIVHRRSGQYDEAITDFTQAIAIDPGFREAHHNLALLYKLHLHDEARARQHFRNFLALGGDPGDEVAQLFRLAEERP